MTRALDTIHSNNMVHRDVNCRNYLVTHDLHTKLHNFRSTLEVTDENQDELKKTIGTAFYCPPVSF
jgi:serine/threonine protein kinase